MRGGRSRRHAPTHGTAARDDPASVSDGQSLGVLDSGSRGDWLAPGGVDGHAAQPAGALL